VTRYLLDTNIISNATKLSPSASLVAWMAEQANEDLFIASLTLGEIWRGILQKPSGAKRAALDEWFHGRDGPLALFRDRILAFDERASMVWADLMVRGKTSGRVLSALDAVIAAVAVANDCIVVTDNVKDFPFVSTLNPLVP
jgi:predicted nucleic acid-binding protein